MDESSGGSDLGSFLEGVEGFNDNSREATRVAEESRDRDLGRTRRRLAGGPDDLDLDLRASELDLWVVEAGGDLA